MQKDWQSAQHCLLLLLLLVVVREVELLVSD